MRFTRDIRVQRNYVRMYTGVSATRGTLSVPHPPPPFHRSRSSSRRWGRKTKSRRGRRHKSLNPVQRIPPTEEVLFSFLSTGFSFFLFLFRGRGSVSSRRSSSRSPSLLFLGVPRDLEEECRCSRRNFRGTELLIGLGMRRSSCSIVRQGISLAVYRFFFRRRRGRRFDPSVRTIPSRIFPTL